MSDFSYLPDRPPPASEFGLWCWLRRNLFASPLHAVLTVLALYVLYRIVPPLFNWALSQSDFPGSTLALTPIRCVPTASISLATPPVDERRSAATPHTSPPPLPNLVLCSLSISYAI